MAQMREQTNRIMVDLGNTKVSKEVSDALEYAVQRAALDVLARVDLKGELVVTFPIEWVGLLVDYQVGELGQFRGGMPG